MFSIFISWIKLNCLINIFQNGKIIFYCCCLHISFSAVRQFIVNNHFHACFLEMKEKKILLSLFDERFFLLQNVLPGKYAKQGVTLLLLTISYWFFYAIFISELQTPIPYLFVWEKISEKSRRHISM